MSNNPTGIKIGKVCKELEISKYELKQWENYLGWKVPKDNRGHRVFNGDWLKYLQKIKQMLSEGKTLHHVLYNIDSPCKRLAPPTVHAVAYGPEL